METKEDKKPLDEKENKEGGTCDQSMKTDKQSCDKKEEELKEDKESSKQDETKKDDKCCNS